MLIPQEIKAIFRASIDGAQGESDFQLCENRHSLTGTVPARTPEALFDPSQLLRMLIERSYDGRGSVWLCLRLVKSLGVLSFSVTDN